MSNLLELSFIGISGTDSGQFSYGLRGGTPAQLCFNIGIVGESHFLKKYSLTFDV